VLRRIAFIVFAQRIGLALDRTAEMFAAFHKAPSLKEDTRVAGAPTTQAPDAAAR
jgi:hypothetical protein